MRRDKDYKDKVDNSQSLNSKSKRVGFGLLLLIVGVMFILRNLDIIPRAVEDIIISWQMLLIGIGLVKLMFDENKAIGGILILVGGFFIVPEIFAVSINFIDVFWPLLLIGAGLIIIFGPGKNLFKRNTVYHTDERYIEELNIFGGNEKVMDIKNFMGGTIQNIFGGTELDLRDCDMEGDKVEIELLCVFGGVELRVPDHWDVVIKVAPIFGGFSNKRIARNRDENNRKVLYITGTVIFGGGEIK